MKKFLLSFIFVLFVGLASAQESKFDTLENADGVTYVYISKSMLSIFNSMDLDLGVDTKDIIGQIKNIRILTAENATASEFLKAETMKIIDSEGFEDVMRMNFDEKRMRIYSKINEDYSELVVISDENGQYTVVSFIGEMTLADFSELT